MKDMSVVFFLIVVGNAHLIRCLLYIIITNKSTERTL